MTEEDPDRGPGFSWGLTPRGATPPDPDTTADPEATQLVEQQAESAPDPAPVPAPTPAPAADPPAAEPPASSRRAAAESGTALDALFGDERFQEYDDGLLPASPASRPAPAGKRVAPAAPPAPVSSRQKVMISVGGVLVALLALIALFFLGTKLPKLLGSTPAAVISPTPTRTPTPTPTPIAAAVGPVAPGVHGWNDLLGGECLDPYTGPWVEEFTVVDCAVPHPAQMVFRGTFDPTTVPVFPGAPALQTQISLLCAAPGVLDLAAAGQYDDAQVQGAYPVTQAEWDAGQHDYFCFISRSSGQPLTGSVAVAKPAP